MWIQDAGEINDRLILLGTRQNSSYLVKGERHMLIGVGGQWVVPELERQMRVREAEILSCIEGEME